MLENLKSVKDLKKLPAAKMELLCQQIRDKLIDTVSKTGGHLASNLGVVELTVALNRVFDPNSDRIIYDIGHQCYVHKMLTGRLDQFEANEPLTSIKGYPNPRESKTDSFIGGHASNSLSVALGMAKARTLMKKDYQVVCVIGDGSFTGGLAYEGMINAATSKEPMIIVLNDNDMPLFKLNNNVKNLSAFRISKSYASIKEAYYNFFNDDSKKVLKSVIHNAKENVKSSILADNLFVDFGFDYIGPFDGHNEEELEKAFEYAKKSRKPIIVHVVTKKGKGYKYAEERSEAFHDVKGFEIESGELSVDNRENYAQHFSSSLTKLAKQNDKLVVIKASVSGGSELKEFAYFYPERFFNVGLADSHALSLAAGMAIQGLVPVFCTSSSFLQRAYDMLVHDVALQNLHVVIGVDKAGLVGDDDFTHQGTFDVSFLRSVPNLTILCPSNYAEMDEMLEIAINEIKGPVVIRYPSRAERNYLSVNSEPTIVLKEGKDITVVSYGDYINEVIDAASLLEKEQINATIIKLNSINPLDTELIEQSVKQTGNLVVVEDGCFNGSIAQAITAEIATNIVYKLKALNTASGIVEQDSIENLYQKYHLDSVGIYQECKKLISK